MINFYVSGVICANDMQEISVGWRYFYSLLVSNEVVIGEMIVGTIIGQIN